MGSNQSVDVLTELRGVRVGERRSLVRSRSVRGEQYDTRRREFAWTASKNGFLQLRKRFVETSRFGCCFQHRLLLRVKDDLIGSGATAAKRWLSRHLRGEPRQLRQLQTKATRRRERSPGEEASFG